MGERVEMTPDAAERLNTYLSAVRRTAAGTAIDADEVAADIHDHVESALASAPAPASRGDLDAVLDRLGRPSDWIGEEDLPPLRRYLRRLARGPEDWRLPYLTFALTVLGVLAFPIGGLVALVVAWFLGRAALDLLAVEGRSAAPKRWLIYPVLALVAALLASLILAGPVPVLLAWGVGDGQLYPLVGTDPEMLAPADTLRLQWGFGLGCLGAWWLVLSGLVAVLPGPLRAVLRPFADRMRRRDALWLSVGGALLCLLAALLVTDLPLAR